MREQPIDFDEKQRAGYNQAQRITETLAMLRNSFVGAMIDDNFPSALKVCRRVLDIISAKLKKEEIKEVNKRIYLIKRILFKAEQTYIHNIDRNRYYHNPEVRIEVEVRIENLWRKIEKLQDEHGYGMLAEEEYGL